MKVEGPVRLQRIVSLLWLHLAAAAYALAQSESHVPPLETIITGMAQARAENRSRLRSYKVTRDYRLFGKDRRETKSEITADITFAPPDVKKYAIQRASGWRLGEKIVRQMLDSETHIVKDYDSTDISAANYDLRFLRQEDVNGQRAFVLELVPKRKDENLLRGNIWVDATTHLPRRIEGEPAKSPSWWLRDVRIALVYSEVGGMWLQTASESTVKVRLFGQHTMVSRDVTYEIGEPDVVADTPAYPLASRLLCGGRDTTLRNGLRRCSFPRQHRSIFPIGPSVVDYYGCVHPDRADAGVRSRFPGRNPAHSAI